MFLLRSTHPNRQGTQLNAIPYPARTTEPETDDAGLARRLRICRRMGEIAEHLAELAGIRAAAQIIADTTRLQTQPPQPTPTDPPEASALEAIAPKTTDYTIIFTRLARIAHTAVALEKRLLEKQPEPAESQIIHHVEGDSRDLALARAIDYAAENHPDRVKINRKADALIFVLLYKDPDGERSLPELYDYVASTLSLKTKFSEIPNEIFHPNRNPTPLIDPNDPAGPKDGYMPQQTNPPIPPF